MKLIRLTTEDPLAYFNNTFNDDLVIKKNSKIALQSLSLDSEATILTIDASNDTLKYQITNSQGEQSIKLDQGTFTSLNYTSLFEDIENKLNNNTGLLPLGFGTKDIGLQWKTGVNSSNKFFLKYEIGRIAEYSPNWKYIPTKVERLSTGVWRQKTTDSNTNNDRSMLFPEYVSTGCGLVRCRTHFYDADAGDPETRGYIIGLSKTNLSTIDPNQFQASMINYAIHVSIDTNGDRKYYTIIDNVSTESTTLPNFLGNDNGNNDFQELIVNFDKVQLNVYQNGNSIPTQLAEYNYVEGQKLYPFVVFRNTSVNFNSIRLTPSPFSTISTNSSTENELTTPPQPPRNIPTKNYIEFSPSVSEFLGYDSSRVPSSGFLDVYEPTFNADRLFDPVDIADAFIVEMLNLKLESYDGFVNQRKNILSIIPKSNSNGEIIYEPNSPLFIDLNNANEILLRNIRCRIVKSDYSRVKMRGIASLVLLIA